MAMVWKSRGSHMRCGATLRPTSTMTISRNAEAPSCSCLYTLVLVSQARIHNRGQTLHLLNGCMHSHCIMLLVASACYTRLAQQHIILAHNVRTNNPLSHSQAPPLPPSGPSPPSLPSPASLARLLLCCCMHTEYILRLMVNLNQQTSWLTECIYTVAAHC